MRRVRRPQALRAGGLRSDDGMTLAETIVAVALTTLVAGFTISLLILGVRSTGTTAVRQDNAGQARVAIEAMSKNLRAAISPSQFPSASCTAGCETAAPPLPAVSAASASSLTFYANLTADGSPPSRVTYAVVGTTLVETLQAPVVASAVQYSFCTPGAGCPVRTRTLARGVVTSSTAPLFTYYKSDGTVLPLTASSTVDDRAAVDSVDLLVRVRTSANWSTPATTVTMRVALPNADYARPAPSGGS